MNHTVTTAPPDQAAATAATTMTANERRASVSLASLYALRMFGLFLVLPVFALHARTLPGGEHETWVGLAMGIYGLTQACLQIPMGVASDRWGRKPVIVFGLALFVLGSVVAALAQSVVVLGLGRALQGAGAISAAVTALLADVTRESVRTKAMALVGASIGLTFALSLVIAPPLYAQVGLSGMFWLTAALSTAAVLLVWRGVPAAPALAPEAQQAVPLRRVLTDPELLRLNLGIFSLHAAQMAGFIVIPQLLLRDAGLPVAQHWHVYLPAVLGSFVVMMPIIGAGERRGQMRTVFLSAIGMLTLVYVLLSQVPHTSWALGGCLLAFFIAFNVLEASLPSLVSRFAPPAAKGAALGVYNTTQSLGLFVGGALGGWLNAHHGANLVFYAAAGLIALWWWVARGMGEVASRRSAR